MTSVLINNWCGMTRNPSSFGPHNSARRYDWYASRKAPDLSARVEATRMAISGDCWDRTSRDAGAVTIALLAANQGVIST
jgi:hypothetical protein